MQFSDKLCHIVHEKEGILLEQATVDLHPL